MIVIHEKFGKGTKSALIELAEKGSGYIVCRNSHTADKIAQIARIKGKAIRFPITHDEFMDGMYNTMHLTEFYIDDVEYLLQKIAGVIPIKAITITKKEN